MTSAAAAARPVLKWAGGKRQLLPHILSLLPERIDTYYEPFIGGGAVFFRLAAERRFRRAVLSDRNADLVTVYKALQEDVEAVIQRLEKLSRRHSEAEYYRIRASRPRTAAARAARIIYLNRTGFNGLYRVNRNGEFNVPFGRYANPKIVDPERLRRAAEALAGARVEVADFEDSCRGARSGDAVYFDPPYLPISATAHFAEYHSEPFGLDEHRRLARLFGALRERGVAAVLSNSDTEATRDLFKAFSPATVAARRAINSNPTRRGPVGELLVSTHLPRRKS